MLTKGDVQMSVSALLVLGERGTGLLEEKTMEQWFSSYIGKHKVAISM